VRSRRACIAGAFLGAALALQGCALLAPPPPETRKEVLDQAPLDVPQRDCRGGTLLVLPPRTRPAYDMTEMAYRVQPHELAYFSQHEWAETPSRMLQPLIAKTLQATRCFGLVVGPPYAGPYRYSLHTELRELVADFTFEPAALQLSLRFQLDDAAGRAVAVKEVSLREPLRQRNPYGSVVAANEATAKALSELAAFVLDSVH
jgi:cholesterol transport system auxiliary component